MEHTQPKPFTPKNIKKLRKELRISQAVMANILNTKVSTIQKWERGVNEPNGPSARLLQILGNHGPKVFQVK